MIQAIDHVAITVADLEVSCDFYARVLDARVAQSFEIDGRQAVRRVELGKVILNIHQQGNGLDLVARNPLPGSADICFRWSSTIKQAQELLARRGVAIVEGPVRRISSEGLPAMSVYFRDPDGNLIELLAS